MLTTQQIRDKFIAHISSQYVIDASGDRPTLLSTSNRTRSIASVAERDFPIWSKSTGIRVPEDKYKDFQENLPRYIRRGLHHVVGTSFKPCIKEGRVFTDVHGDVVMNTFRPYQPAKPDNYEYCRQQLDAYFDFVFHQNGDDKKMVRQFLAHAVQFPLDRPQYGLVVRGNPATGKSTFIALLRAAFGGNHVNQCDQVFRLFAQFSPIVPDNIAVALDDVRSFPKDFEEQMKNVVTNPIFNLETKGKQGIIAHTIYTRFFVISNEHRPFLLSNGCRRWYITEFIDHQVDEEHSKQWLAQFYGFYSDRSNWPGIYHYFMGVNLDDFNPVVRKITAARNEIVGLSTSCADSTIKEFIGGYTEEVEDAEGKTITVVREKRGAFHINSLHEFFKDRKLPELLPDQVKLKLQAVGYEPKPRVISPEVNAGKQVVLWQPLKKGRSPSLTEDQKAEIGRVYDPTF